MSTDQTKEALPEVAITDNGLAPTNMDQLWRMSKMVAVSGRAPKGMDTPEQIFVAFAHGLEIGLKPMQSLQKIAVINGRPSVWGDAMMGLVLASGLCEDVEEHFEGDPGSEGYTAVCTVKRKGMPQAVATFSVADAIRAGLWTKDIWKKYPARMLKMRARAFALRDRFADVLGGLYMTEELQGEDERQRIVVDNTKGDDDLASALVSAPAVQDSPSELPPPMPDAMPISTPGVVVANQEPIDTTAEEIPTHEEMHDEIPFDPHEISRMMDEEVGSDNHSGVD